MLLSFSILHLLSLFLLSFSFFSFLSCPLPLPYISSSIFLSLSSDQMDEGNTLVFTLNVTCKALRGGTLDKPLYEHDKGM